MAQSLLDWTEAARWGECYAHIRPVPQASAVTIDRLHLLVRTLAASVQPVVSELTEPLGPTGLAELAQTPRVHVVSRKKLVSASVDSMRAIADPHAKQFLAASKVPAPIRRHAWAHNLGLVAGIYAANTLAQHELFIPPAHTSGRTWVVGPNVTALASRVGSRVADVLAGVLCIQLTNRILIEGVPWIRPYANAILNAYIREVDSYDKAFTKAMERFSAFFFEANLGEHASGTRDAVHLSLTSRQVRAVQAGQAFFAVMEGYAQLISQLASTRLGLDAQLVARTLRGQTEGHHVMLRFTHVVPGLGISGIGLNTGLELVREAYATGGIALVNRLWEDPTHLPTLAELNTPSRWIRRVMV